MCTEKEGKEDDEMEIRHSSVHAHRRCSAALCLSERREEPVLCIYIHIYMCRRAGCGSVRSLIHSVETLHVLTYTHVVEAKQKNNACI